MDTITAILTRRSARRFTSETISDDTINDILKAAMSAPSAANEQPWHFIVIKDKTILENIAKVHPHALMCKQASFAIMVCIDLNQENYRDFWVQDLSAATQNILLALRDYNLGGVWVGIYPAKERVSEISKLLDLPENVIPFNLIPFGHTDVSQEETKERFKKDRIHYNKW